MGDQLVVFKEKSGGARLVERGAGRMGEHPGEIREGFKKPARDRKGQENTNAGNYKAPRRAAGRQGRASSIEQFFLMFRCEF